MDIRTVPAPAIQRRGHRDPASGTMKKKIACSSILLALVAALFLWGMQLGYKRGYAAGSQVTNNWWIEKKVKQFETSEVIKKRLSNHHQAI
jgi:hypothetical protein